MKLTVLACAAAGALFPMLAGAQSTMFTYQGALERDGVPASGLHDMRFRLFDEPVDGNQIGPTLCADSVAATEGRFAVQLDFGQQFATPSPRFIEIAVRPEIGQPCTDQFAYVTLAPRRQLRPTPTASHAKSAFSLDAPDGSPASALFVDNAGNIGIGTTAPAAVLHVKDELPFLVLRDSGSNATQLGFISLRNSAGSETGWFGFGTSLSTYLGIQNTRLSGSILLLPARNVGIQTTEPAAKLEVRGDIRMGSSGQFHAPAGEENLRIISGTIAFEGHVLHGTGFTSQRIDVGKYRITFTTSFAGVPSVTAVVNRGSDSAIVVSTDFGSPTASQVTLVTWRLQDNNWGASNDISFIAVGPR